MEGLHHPSNRDTNNKTPVSGRSGFRMIPDDSGGTDDSSIVLLSHADLPPKVHYSPHPKMPKANRGLGLPILHLQEKPQVRAPDYLETDERMVDHSIRIGKLSMV